MGRPRFALWVTVWGLALGAACAGTELGAEARGIRGAIKTARDKGAYSCAPGELALAESHVEFAEQELDQGDYFRAKDHLRIADWNAREALRLTSSGACGRPAPAPPRPGDGDGDGLVDAADKCPAEPEDRDGHEDADGCPEPDNDADGILDPSDRCPKDAEDADGFEDADGCPDPDNDKDGVLDAMDRCPTEKEDTDGFEDGDGCPDVDNDKDGLLDGEDKCPLEAGLRLHGGCPQKFSFITVTEEKIELKQQIFFQTAKATILPKSFPLLDEVAQVLKGRPTMKVRIEGHTDSRGSRTTNVRLSQARADAVRTYLAGHGVEAARLEARGFGPDQPIETNRTAAGREKNRRVEFVITQP
jgi:outer membrane protein OmpA-like peptidoglycan-associated protein